MLFWILSEWWPTFWPGQPYDITWLMWHERYYEKIKKNDECLENEVLRTSRLFSDIEVKFNVEWRIFFDEKELNGLDVRDCESQPSTDDAIVPSVYEQLIIMISQILIQDIVKRKCQRPDIKQQCQYSCQICYIGTIKINIGGLACDKPSLKRMKFS